MKYYFDEKERRIKLKDGKDTLELMYLSNLMPINLPGIFGLMNLLFTSFKMNYNIKNLVFDCSEKKQVIHVPRMCIGDIVIQRRGWIIKQSVFDYLQDISDEKELYKEFILKLEELKLPDEFFIKSLPHSEKNASVEKNIEIFNMKPIYFNKNNVLEIIHIFKLLPKTEYMFFEEVLPNFKDNDYVKENIVEYSRKG